MDLSAIEYSYVAALGIVNNNQEIKRYLEINDLKDKGIENLSDFRADVSLIVFCRLIIRREFKIDKVKRCMNTLNFCIRNSGVLKDLMNSTLIKKIVEYKEKGTKEIYYKYRLISSIDDLDKSSSYFTDFENKLIEKIKSGIKKLFFVIKGKRLIKYLGLCYKLQFLREKLNKEIQILSLFSIKYLESKYSLLVSKNPQNIKIKLKKGCILCKVLFEIGARNRASSLVLSKFQEIYFAQSKYKSYRLSSFPLTLKKNIPISFTSYSFTQEHTVFNYPLSSPYISVITYFIANNQSKKNLFFYNLLDSQSLKHCSLYLFLLKKFKSSVRSIHSIPKLKFYEYRPNDLVIITNNYYYHLPTLLNQKKQEPGTIPENLQKLWVKSLINTFYHLEKIEIHHGNLTPYSLYITDKWTVYILDFPCIGITLEQNQPLFNTTSYKAPEAPFNYNQDFNYIGHKSDVFSLGAIFLQINTLNTTENIHSNQESIVQSLAQVSFDWLRYILSFMLFPDYTQRANFSQLRSQIKTLLKNN